MTIFLTYLKKLFILIFRTTKVEGMLAITRLATFHSHSLLKDQHQMVLALVNEVKNLRSTVARSAIFTIGELFAKLKSQIEPVI
jgi:hypothetical protein